MISKLIIIGWTLFIGYSFISGLGNVQDGGASEEMFAFVMIISAIGHFAIWALVAMPTYMISRMSTKRQSA